MPDNTAYTELSKLLYKYSTLHTRTRKYEYVYEKIGKL